MSVGRICSRDVYLADLNESAAMAAIRMRDQQVGTLVVVDEGKKPIGILTDRDLAVRVVASGRAADACTVAEVMTHSPRTVREQASIEDALAEMAALGVRRMPVVDAADCLAGIVSVDDVLSLVGEEISRIGRLLDRQGAAPPEGAPGSESLVGTTR